MTLGLINPLLERTWDEVMGDAVHTLLESLCAYAAGEYDDEMRAYVAKNIAECLSSTHDDFTADSANTEVSNTEILCAFIESMLEELPRSVRTSNTEAAINLMDGIISQQSEEVMERWQLTYCGGSAHIENQLREIGEKHNVSVCVESFDW